MTNRENNKRRYSPLRPKNYYSLYRDLFAAKTVPTSRWPDPYHFDPVLTGTYSVPADTIWFLFKLTQPHKCMDVIDPYVLNYCHAFTHTHSLTHSHTQTHTNSLTRINTPEHTHRSAHRYYFRVVTVCNYRHGVVLAGPNRNGRGPGFDSVRSVQFKSRGRSRSKTFETLQVGSECFCITRSTIRTGRSSRRLWYMIGYVLFSETRRGEVITYSENVRRREDDARKTKFLRESNIDLRSMRSARVKPDDRGGPWFDEFATREKLSGRVRHGQTRDVLICRRRATIVIVFHSDTAYVYRY